MMDWRFGQQIWRNKTVVQQFCCPNPLASIRHDIEEFTGHEDDLAG
ncbi:MAG: hypothetical protein R3F31_00925 [Verrucomicrobiales bacterium]